MSTITIAPTVEMDSRPARVRLDVTDSGSSPAYTETTLLRVNPDGRSSPVRTNDGGPLVLTTAGAVRVGLLYDYEAPYGLPVTYTTVENPATVSSQVTVDESRVWLIHPGVPELSQPVTVAEFGARSRSAPRGVYYPLGRKYPVVHTDGQRKAPEFTLTLYTQTLTEINALETLCADLADLLFNVPVGKSFGIDAEYVSVGDLTESRLMRFAGEPGRYWDLPCIVTDRPSGGTQADRTYADLLIYANYAALQTAYPDYQSLLSGP